MRRTAKLVAKSSLALAAGFGLFVGTHAVLAGITESYRVYGNDILPSLGTLWGGIRHFEACLLGMFYLPAILLVLSLLTGFFLVFKPRWAPVPLGVLVVCFLVSIRAWPFSDTAIRPPFASERREAAPIGARRTGAGPLAACGTARRGPSRR